MREQGGQTPTTAFMLYNKRRNLKMKLAFNKALVVNYKDKNFHLRIMCIDKKNPVVLFLHGGCGCPDRAQVMKNQKSLAARFTLVCWDQTGAGYSYKETKKSHEILTKDSYVEDTHNLMLYLKDFFDQEKIILACHSFGTALGIWVCKKYPEDVLFYVGSGQVVDYVRNEEISYSWLLEQCKNNKDKRNIKKLEALGFPEDGMYKKNHPMSVRTQRAILHRYGGCNFNNRKPYWAQLIFDIIPVMLREYSFFALANYLRGINYTVCQPVADVNPDLINKVKKLNVPVFLFQGTYDMNCPTSLAQQWLENLECPKKKLILFDGSAHSPQNEEFKLWNERFVEVYKSLILI